MTFRKILAHALVWSVFLCGFSSVAMGQEAIGPWLETLRARVVRNAGTAGRPIIALYVNGSKLNDEDLRKLSQLTTLRGLSLRNAHVSQAGLQAVARMPQLRALEFSDTNLTSADISIFLGAKQLHTLRMDKEAVDDALLATAWRLGKLQTLHATLGRPWDEDLDLDRLCNSGPGNFPKNADDVLELNLYDTQITDDGMKYISAYRNLRSLSLRDLAISDTGFQRLSALERLRILDLAGTKLTADGLLQLAVFPNLHTLSLETSQVTDEVLLTLDALDLLQTLITTRQEFVKRRLQLREHDRLPEYSKLDFALDLLRRLSALKRVTHLYLGGTSVNGSGVKALVGMNRLESLSLNSTGVTDKELKYLCKIDTLKSISLAYTTVTDVGMLELSQMKRLESLDLAVLRLQTEKRKEDAAHYELN